MRPHPGPQSGDHWTCPVNAASQFPSDAWSSLLPRQSGKSPLHDWTGACSHLLGGSQQWGRDIPVLRSCLCQTLRACCTVAGRGSFPLYRRRPDSRGTCHLLGSDKMGSRPGLSVLWLTCFLFLPKLLRPQGQAVPLRTVVCPLQLRSKQFQSGHQVQCAGLPARPSAVFLSTVAPSFFKEAAVSYSLGPSSRRKAPW